jgi:hypothetical protein
LFAYSNKGTYRESLTYTHIAVDVSS